MFRKIVRAVATLFEGRTPLRILVVGTGKCGSTALYFRIKKSLPPDAIGLFEPAHREPIVEVLDKGAPIVVKMLLPIDPALQGDLDREFPYRVLLVRDPRDVLVSTALYTTATQFCWRHAPEAIHEEVGLLEAKERRPDAVSLLSIFKKLWDGFTPEEFAGLIGQLSAETDRLSRPPHGYFVFRYEDLVANRLEALEAYLGMRLVRDDSVDADFSRVVRTKGAGGWRDWFTEEDMAYFRPLFRPSMERFGYNVDDWQTSLAPHIDAAHCSRYFLRVLNERRRHEGLAEIAL